MPNVALGKTCTANNFYNSSSTPDKAVDGDANTAYSSLTANFATDYWQVDLGITYTITSVTINSLPGYGSRSAYLRVTASAFSDGSSATIIGSLGASPTGADVITPSGTVSGRYIRIFRFQSAPDNNMTLAEIDVQAGSTLAFPYDGVVTTAQNSVNTSHAITMSGGSTPLTAAVYRSTVSGFAVPGTATLLSGATSVSGLTITVTDTTGIPGQLYFYKTVVTDATAFSITSNQIAGMKAFNKLKILFIGDSITSSYACVAKTKPKLQEGSGVREVQVVNSGASGSRSNDWISGSTNLTTAKNSAVAAFGTPSTTNPVYVSVMLGVNDPRVSPPGNSASTFQANILSLCNNLITAGYAGVILHAPPLLRIPQGVSNGYDSEAGMANLLAYVPVLDAICNGTTILKGDRQATQYFAVNWGEFVADAVSGTATWVHPNTTGEDSYATFWSKGILDAIYPNRIKRKVSV